MTPPLYPDNIPAELKRLRQWVTWALEPDAEQPGRWAKVPYWPCWPKRRASSTAPVSWGTFDQALSFYSQSPWAAGVGIVLAAGLVGVDLDKCIEAGQAQPWAAEVATTLDSFAAKSQSGAGLHVLAWGTLPPGPRRRGQVEAYDAARFFAMTGDVYGTRRTVESRTSELHAMHAPTTWPPQSANKPTAPTKARPSAHSR